MLDQLRSIWRYRYFWLSLVQMDLLTKYRKSFLGVGWSLVYPIAMTAVFVVVFREILVSGGDWRLYAQNTLAGMTMWDFFKNSMTQGCTALTRNESYIRQAPLPFALYPLRTVLGLTFHFLISMSVLVVLVAILNPHGITVESLLIIPVILGAVVLCWSIATLTAFATAFFHDITHIIEVSAQILFFVTPIIYTRSNMTALAWTVDFNPFALYIELIRDPLVMGTAASFQSCMLAGLYTCGAFGLAIATIAWLQRKVIFHL